MKAGQLLIAIILLSVCINSIAQKNILTRESKYNNRNVTLLAAPGQIQSHLPGSYHPDNTRLLNDKNSSIITTTSRFFTPPIPDKSGAPRKTLSSDITSIYNYKEKLDSMIYYDWDWNLMSWALGGIERYIYDIYGRTIEYETEVWNAETGYQRSKQTFKYDPDGNVINMITHTWNDNLADWIPDYRTDYLYEPDGNLKETYNYTYAYDPPYMEWVINNKTEYFYDERNNPTLSLGYYWDNYNFLWIESNKTETFFDENSRDTLSIFYSFTDGIWFNSSRQIMNYDLQGNEILYEWYIWNGIGWDPGEKETYSYNAENRPIQYIYYGGWNYNLSSWISTDREDYIYDLTGNVIEIDYFYWDTNVGGWNPDYKDEHTYDLSANEGDIAMPNWWNAEVYEKFHNTSKVTKAYEFLFNGEMGSWDTTEITTLYYSDFLSTPEENLCKAEFNWIVDSVNPYMIHFQNLSAADAVSWYWDFGDGTTGTLNSPSHVYKSDGIYTVTLSAIDQTAFCNSSISYRIVIGIPECNAFFIPLIDTLKRMVSFQNESTGAVMNYFWNFGDGTVSTLKDPPFHQYMKFGIYDVSLTIRNDAGTCMDEFSIRLPLTLPQCNADFTVFVDSTYNVAYFNSKAKDPANKYYWIFGDGSISTLSNPVHRFSQPGYFSAMLTVSNEKLGCIDSRKEIILIGSTGIDCKADFIYNVGEDNNVFFSDKSSVPAKNYYWNFGDGVFSQEMNPSHKYPGPGYYNVCFTIYAENNIQNITCKKILVAKDEIDLCMAQFYYLVNDSDLTVFLTDGSFGTPDSWQWKFNDGWTSKLQNPTYNARKPDYYLAHLQIQNSSTGCEDDAFELVNVSKDKVLKAAFGFIKKYSGLKADSYPVDFISVSLGEGSKLKWDFGDGTYDSTTTTPNHVYTAPGAYNVCYTITDQVTGQTDTYCQIVFVGISGNPPGLIENGFQLISYPNPFNKVCNIAFTVDFKGPVELSLYDPSGRRVADIDRSVREPGRHEMEFDGSGLDSGVYYLLLRTQTGYATSLINVIK
jgi:PKD repeat protein